MALEKLTEFRVLLSAVSLVVHGVPSVEGRDEWIQELSCCDLNVLSEMAVAHGLLPWLMASLRSATAYGAGQDLVQFSENLNSLHRVSQFHCSQQAGVVTKVSSLLTAEGIDHIVFKGLAALHQFYDGFVSTRVSDDLDILVAPESMPHALSVLMRNGYRAGDDCDVESIARFVKRHAALYRWRDIGLQNDSSLPHKIDLHWSIADRFTYPADVNNLIQARVFEQTSYGVIPCLPLNEHFVYVCVHGYSDYFFRLRHLVDVYAALQQPGFSLDESMKIAKRNGVERIVLECIDLANVLLGGSFKSQFGGDDRRYRYTKGVIDRFHQSGGWPQRAHPNKASWSFRDKYRHLKRQISNRSRRSSWLAPLRARVLLDGADVKAWDGNRLDIIRLFLRRLTRKLF